MSPRRGGGRELQADVDGAGVRWPRAVGRLRERAGGAASLVWGRGGRPGVPGPPPPPRGPRSPSPSRRDVSRKNPSHPPLPSLGGFGGAVSALAVVVGERKPRLRPVRRLVVAPTWPFHPTILWRRGALTRY